MQSQKLLFLLCLCLSGRLVLAQNAASGEKNPFAGDPAAVRAGRKLFADSCEVCHGGGARGGRGPALATGNFQHGGDDWQIFQSIRNGIFNTQMPPFDLSTAEIWQLVTYLKSLSGSMTEEKVPGDFAAGEKVFAGKGSCNTCHQVNGRGGRLGPELSTIGRWSASAWQTITLRISAQS
jgi:cytochrome c oxidase cbb3-type subunit III